MQKLTTIDERLRVADRKVRLISRINPLNSKNEFRKVTSAYRRGKVYNPYFRYPPVKISLQALADELKNLTIHTPLVKNERWFFTRHLEKKRERILAKINTLKSRGTPLFRVRVIALFGMPNKQLVRYSRKMLRRNTKEMFDGIKDNLSSLQAADILQDYLEKRALPWRAVIRKGISSKVGLDSRSKYLLIKAGEKFASEEILSLAVHEIETHIYRRENGARQKMPGLFSEGFAGPPTTEEGLAFFNETVRNYDPRRLKIICARTVAVHLAKRKSFFEVFRRLMKYGFPIPYAWTITLRAKRGFADTSLPGSFSKDHHYLKGYLEIKKFLTRGGKIESLYTGKINIENIKSIKKLKIKTAPPTYLPHYL